jgi:hypothetical protein
MELHQLREELLQPFSPDDGLAGVDMHRNKGHSWTSAQFERNVSFDEVSTDSHGLRRENNVLLLSMSPVSFSLIGVLNFKVVEPKEDLISDISCTDLPLFLRTPIHTPAANVISVNQLLESVSLLKCEFQSIHPHGHSDNGCGYRPSKQLDR